MRLLLTSGGITNGSIRSALRALLEEEFRQSRLAFIPTAAAGQGGSHDWFVDDLNRIYRLGWREFSIVELNGLPKEVLVGRLESTDVIYAGGGNAYHLAYSILANDLAADLLRLLDTKVYVGASAGSMILGKDLTERMVAMCSGGDELYQLAGGRPVSPFNLFDWHIQPHVDFQTWDEAAYDTDFPYYAIDDQTAIQVVGDRVEVVSEGS